jgi:hypothetical protein
MVKWLLQKYILKHAAEYSLAIFRGSQIKTKRQIGNQGTEWLGKSVTFGMEYREMLFSKDEDQREQSIEKSKLCLEEAIPGAINCN